MTAERHLADLVELMRSVLGEIRLLRQELILNRDAAALRAIETAEPETPSAAEVQAETQSNDAPPRPVSNMKEFVSNQDLVKEIQAVLKSLHKHEADFNAWFQTTYKTQMNWTQASIEVKRELLALCRKWARKAA